MLYNANNPGDKQNGIFAVSAIFMGMVWVTLSLRLWVRLILVKNQGWDDALLVFAALLFTAFCGMIIKVETIVPRVLELDFAQLSDLVGMVVACLDLYLATMIAFKISLAIFYLRIMLHAWQRHVVVAAVVLNTVYGVFLFFTALFNCGDPTQYLANQLKGVCLKERHIYIIQLVGCIINAATDWVFAGLPIFLLAKTTIPLAAKVSAGFILLLACCGSIVSMVRIRYIKGLKPGPDFFNTVVDLAIWTIVECGLGIAAASAATLRPLFRSLMDPTPRGASPFSMRPSCKTSPTCSTDTNTSYTRSALTDLESQGHVSHFSRWSLAPLLRSPRLRGKLGITGRAGPKKMKQVGRGPASKDAAPISRPWPLSAQPPPTPPKPTMHAQMARQMSQRLKTKIGITAARHNHRVISPPIPHIASCQVPPAPEARRSREGVNIVDYRKAGSPDWTRNGEQLAPWMSTTQQGGPLSDRICRVAAENHSAFSRR